MRATHANISPIFGSFLTGRRRPGVIERRLAERRSPSAATITGDAPAVEMVGSGNDQAFAEGRGLRDVLIADGHHRYETAWNFSAERFKQDRANSPPSGRIGMSWRFSVVVGSGLVIEPTHRAVRWRLRCRNGRSGSSLSSR